MGELCENRDSNHPNPFVRIFAVYSIQRFLIGVCFLIDVLI